MHIGIIRRRRFVIAGTVAVACSTFSAMRAIAVTISNGAYLGAPGANASGSDMNEGGTGGNGYDFSGANNLITGGEFFGGNGGNATGGSQAFAGGGGNGVQLDLSGSLTITGGTFQGGMGGTASGAQANSQGYGGSAVELEGENTNALLLVYGGTFQGAYDFLVFGGTFKVEGSFVGGPRTITPYFTSTGTFSGLLDDNTTPATYSYEVASGAELILEPEPTACASLIFPAIMLLRRRGRQAV